MTISFWTCRPETRPRRAWLALLPDQMMPELAGGQESLAETVADLPRPELERLLCLAIVELMESQQDAEKQVSRIARRLQEKRST
jgi:hypothetical protein